MSTNLTNECSIDTRGVAEAIFSNEAGGGVQISGSSGCGKSNLMAMLALLIMLSPRKIGLCLLDPHGTLAKMVRRLAVCERGLSERVLFVSPADISGGVVPLNPLSVNVPCNDETEWLSKVATKVDETARILLMAWGERDFNSKPVLFKWTKAILGILAYCKLPLSFAFHFLNTNSPNYRDLVSLIPDPLLRHDFLDLANMRPRDREDEIRSTKNRLLGFLHHPVVMRTFGSTEAVDLYEGMQQGQIYIVDLSKHEGNISGEVQEVIANVWCNEVLNTNEATAENKRREFALMIDELPVFKSTGPLLVEAMRQIRKRKLRVIAAHQGSDGFDGGLDDPLLNAFVSTTGIKFLFQHRLPKDARHFADIAYLPTYDPLRMKYEHIVEEQRNAGEKIIELYGHSHNWSKAHTSGTAQDQGQSQQTNRNRSVSDVVAEGSNETVSVSETESSSQGDSENDGYVERLNVLDDLVGMAMNQVKGKSWSTSQSTANGRAVGKHQSTKRDVTEGEGESQASSQSRSNSQQVQQSDGGSMSVNQAVVSKYEIVEKVASVTHLTIDEQRELVASEITRHSTGECTFLGTDNQHHAIKLPLVEDPHDYVRGFAQKQEIAHGHLLAANPLYVLTNDIDRWQDQVLECLVDEAQRLSVSPSPAVEPLAFTMPQTDNSPFPED